MTALADAIATAVLEEFAKLPSKRKPAIRDNGLHEWVPLSGIVLEKNDQFTCVAMASGMKCLPSSRLPASNGVGIHDWHAEVLTIRAFNRFILDECHRLLLDGQGSDIVQRDDSGSALVPFLVKQDVRLHMYCSEAPCGDASMELTMADQEDSTPWTLGNEDQKAVAAQGSLPGRAFFSQLGVVRRKPARGDAPPSMSKSCSDKLAAKQCLSLLSSITSLFVSASGAYIDTLVLPEDRYSATGCSRAFGPEGRMRAVANSTWGAGYGFNPFRIATTSLHFDFSKASVEARGGRISASNLAAAWTQSGLEETIIGGVIQGRKAFHNEGASKMSRRAMWTKAKALSEMLGENHRLDATSYKDIKQLPALTTRAAVKSNVRTTALAGWIRNEGDDGFQLKDA